MGENVIYYNLCTFSKISIICCTQVYCDDFACLKTIYVYLNQGKKIKFLKISKYFNFSFTAQNQFYVHYLTELFTYFTSILKISGTDVFRDDLTFYPYFGRVKKIALFDKID